MSTAWIIVGGILILLLVFVIDFKVVEWILRGGLKSFKRRLFIIYLPMAVWVISIFLGTFWYGTECSDWCRRLTMIISVVYGVGFTLHYFMETLPPTRSMLIGGLMVVWVAVYAVDAAGFRFNLTPSMAKGIYVLEPAAEKPERGDLVTFCLESDNPFTSVAKERNYIGSGTCPSGLKPFLKQLAGLSGDIVGASPDGIILNGHFLAGTSRPEYDSHGRLVPPSLLKDGPIPEGLALVISQQHSGSFDSRHFGLVPYESLQKVSPVLTDNPTPKEGDQIWPS